VRIKAIPTDFAGVEFRSRLEARWASFMSMIGWDWVYEPFDGDGYIPDFLVQGARPLLIEVKPAVTRRDYEAAVPKAERGLADHGYDLLIVGASPIPTDPAFYGDSPLVPSELVIAGRVATIGWHPLPAAGLLGECNRGWAGDDPLTRVYGAGLWVECSDCGQIGVTHDLMDYTRRPCGHYDGSQGPEPSKHRLVEAWSAAGNAVKWNRGPR
jgi:hypothetical protein